MILQNGRSSSSCKKRLRNCPQLQKIADAMIEDLRSAIVKLLILHPIYLKHPVDMATALLLLHFPHDPIFANIRLSPECDDGSQGSLRYYEGRRVFSV